MIAVIFELEPLPGAAPRYFDWAAALKPELEAIDGFISVERFESLAQPRRNRGLHRQAQREGRDEILAHYRLCVASVLRDYGLLDRDQAPPDSRAVFPPS